MRSSRSRGPRGRAVRRAGFGLLTVAALLAGRGSWAAEAPLAVPLRGGALELPLAGVPVDRAERVVVSFLETPVPVGTNAAGERVATLPLPRLGEEIGAFRIAWVASGRAGFSAPGLTLADSFPSMADAGTNTVKESVQRLQELPVAIDGRLEARQARHYAVRLRKGETLAVEVVARRVGSSLDPRLRLRDPAGAEVLGIEDTAGADGDVAVRLTARKAGWHGIEVGTRAGEEASGGRFRLRLHRGELATLPFPGAGGEATPVMAPGGRIGALPATIAGQFRSAGERLVWEVEGTPGEWMAVRFRGRATGSWADVLALVRDPSGKVVGELDATGAGDGVLGVRFASRGVHRLEVWELSRAWGPAHFIEARVEPGPAMELSVDKNLLEAGPGGTAEVKLTLNRRETPGAVALRWEGLPEGVTAEPLRLEGNAKEANLRIRVPTNGVVEGPWRLRLFGRAMAVTNATEVLAGTRGPVLGQWPTLHQPPSAWNGVILLRVKR